MRGSNLFIGSQKMAITVSQQLHHHIITTELTIPALTPTPYQTLPPSLLFQLFNIYNLYLNFNLNVYSFHLRKGEIKCYICIKIIEVQ